MRPIPSWSFHNSFGQIMGHYGQEIPPAWEVFLPIQRV
jgi:hypothetical protein